MTRVRTCGFLGLEDVGDGGVHVRYMTRVRTCGFLGLEDVGDGGVHVIVTVSQTLQHLVLILVRKSINFTFENHSRLGYLFT